MPRKASLYLDTSVPSALFQKPVERKETTAQFFQEILPSYDVFISNIVVEEIKATPDESLGNLLLKAVESFHVLPPTEEAESLAKEYLRYLKMPEADALHIAIASMEGMDYLVTWNMEHLAREPTRRIVDNVNFLLKRRRLYIVVPKDFFD